MLVVEGQKKGEIIEGRAPSELVKYYALQERAVLYDWCICEGDYPLSSYGVWLLKFSVENMKKRDC